MASYISPAASVSATDPMGAAYQASAAASSRSSGVTRHAPP